MTDRRGKAEIQLTDTKDETGIQRTDRRDTTEIHLTGRRDRTWTQVTDKKDKTDKRDKIEIQSTDKRDMTGRKGISREYRPTDIAGRTGNQPTDRTRGRTDNNQLTDKRANRWTGTRAAAGNRAVVPPT